MDALFKSLKDFVRTQTCVIDNPVFRLHYRATFIILIGCSILVTARQYFGDPIDCISKDDVPAKVLDTYCWIHTTFSLEGAWFKKVGVEVPYPGVDKFSENGSETKVYHAYYQWVCFVLFFQALSFYVPRVLWKSFERGRCKTLILGFNQPILSADDQTKNRNLLVSYLVRNASNHQWEFYLYSLCELANFFNVILQMYLTDRFLHGEFSTFGFKVMAFSEWDWQLRYDPMVRVFPRMTKCTFYRYGSSGDIMKYDTLCILPVNIINEKIYIFLWFWFYALAIVSFCAILYRIAIWSFPGLRVMSTARRARIVRRELIGDVVRHVALGDWYLIDLLAKNMHPIHFREVLIDFHRRMMTAIDQARNGGGAVDGKGRFTSNVSSAGDAYSALASEATTPEKEGITTP